DHSMDIQQLIFGALSQSQTTNATSSIQPEPFMWNKWRGRMGLNQEQQLLMYKKANDPETITNATTTTTATSSSSSSSIENKENEEMVQNQDQKKNESLNISKNDHNHGRQSLFAEVGEELYDP